MMVIRVILISLSHFLLAAVCFAQAPDQAAQISNPISREQMIELQGPAVVTSSIPEYPSIAAAKRVSGNVLVDVKINRNGNVIEARVIIGHKLLSDAARKAALRWKFQSADTNEVRSVRLTFVFREVDYVALKEKPDCASPYRVEIEWRGAL